MRHLTGRRAFAIRKLLTSIAFLTPVLVLLTLFFLYPLVQVVIMSVQDWQVLGTNQFVGLANYVNAVHDVEFWQSLWNTVIYTVIVTPLIFLPAILLSFLLQQTTTLTKALRTLYFLPVTISFVAAGYIWAWIYNDTYGVLNYILVSGDLLPRPIDWLGETWRARVMVSVMIAWKTQGLSMMILLAGLQSVPNEVYEAARIDGAQRRQELFHITLPLIRPTLLLALILSVAGSFKAFDHFYIMTQGGPLRTTQTIVMYLNKIGFEFFELGKGASVSVLFLILLLFLSYQQLRIGGYFDE
jgi:multiple sugar transport system permease protein